MNVLNWQWCTLPTFSFKVRSVPFREDPAPTDVGEKGRQIPSIWSMYSIMTRPRKTLAKYKNRLFARICSSSDGIVCVDRRTDPNSVLVVGTCFGAALRRWIINHSHTHPRAAHAWMCTPSAPGVGNHITEHRSTVHLLFVAGRHHQRKRQRRIPRIRDQIA